MADLLIKKGANVNIADHSGKTSLHWAAREGDFKFLFQTIKSISHRISISILLKLSFEQTKMLSIFIDLFR